MKTILCGLTVDGDISLGPNNDIYLKPKAVENAYPDIIRTSEIGMRVAAFNYTIHSQNLVAIGDNIDLKELAEDILEIRQAESDMRYWAKNYLKEIDRPLPGVKKLYEEEFTCATKDCRC